MTGRAALLADEYDRKVGDILVAGGHGFVERAKLVKAADADAN